ncbi:cystathionine gamma-synthase [Balneolales bacterium ANBcel1]|nr:cystathionine gamma-synthase [Balneolales bacterium ANBcel1]
MRFNTKTIHAGQHPEETSGAVMPPVFFTSTYAQEAPNRHKGHEYARVTNPTRTAFEKLLAGLEEADHACAFASGCAAMDALLKRLRPGDHVIATNDIYGGSYRLFTQVFEPYGIRFSFIDMGSVASVREAITPQTRMLWIETPTNPLLNLVDIATLSREAGKRNILTVVDNTFASPALQKPLLLGADAVVHSTTKYIGGHSDLIGGAVCTSNSEILDNLLFQTKTTGAVPGPMDCYLALRGVKTLGLRMERSCHNARVLADFLADHPDVAEVRYPGHTGHPGHEIARAQMSDFGGMVSFSLKKDDTGHAHAFMSSTRIFTLAESLGGVESLISHPASMTHASIPKEEREAAGLNDSLIRLSVGIEDAEDLVEDLQSAFRNISV